MGADVHRLVLRAAVHQGKRMIDLVGIGETVIAAIFILGWGKSGIPAGSTVEGLLHIVDRGHILLDVAEHAQVNFQEIVEHVLIHAHVAGEVSHLFVQYHAIVLHVTQRHAVARSIAAAHERHMVVLHESRLLYLLLPVGVMALVNEHESLILEHSAVVVGLEHVKILIHTIDAETRIVTDAGSTFRALLGQHLNHTRCATAAILRRFGSIFQDGETLDIGRIDARQGRKVAKHTIDDDERVVTTRERGRTAHTHGIHGGHPVVALLHRQARHAAIDGIERIGHLLFVHLVFGDFLHASRQHRRLGIALIDERVARRRECLRSRGAGKSSNCH